MNPRQIAGGVKLPGVPVAFHNRLHFTTGCILQLVLDKKKKAALTVPAARAAKGGKLSHSIPPSV